MAAERDTHPIGGRLQAGFDSPDDDGRHDGMHHDRPEIGAVHPNGAGGGCDVKEDADAWRTGCTDAAPMRPESPGSSVVSRAEEASWDAALESGRTPCTDDTRSGQAMTLTGDCDPFRMDSRARMLAQVHDTALSYERDRQARERGHADWAMMMDDQPRRLRDSVILIDEWLRPVDPADGDVGGWPLVPSFNPIAEDRLPVDPTERDARIEAMCTLLMRMMTDVLFIRPVDERASCHLASAVVRCEIAVANRERRRASLVECDRALRTMEDRCEGRANVDGGGRGRFGDALREVTAERECDDSEGSVIVSSLAGSDDPAARHVIAGAKRAFMWFRNPVIATMVA
jgi:hypothetical protein